jgi:hypothetical protein
VFTMFLGSHFADWNRPDNIMRAILATPGIGLTSCMAGAPHWFCHHMALGEPIGYSTRLTMNNNGLYQNHTNAIARAIYVALMGDPALRMEPVAPVSNLSATPGAGSAHLSWTASAEPVLGYHVYRSASPAGPFSRLTGSMVTGTSFTDTSPFGSNTRTYMVRAVKLQVNPSGSYLNPSQGIFVTVTVGSSTPPITVLASRNGSSLRLSWNSQAGKVYRVQAKNSLTNPSWTDISGGITATGTVTSWTDSNIHSTPRRFYRVAQ